MSARLVETVAIIGFGAIGRVLAEFLLADPAGPRLVAVAIRSNAEAARAALPPQVAVAGNLAELLQMRPDLAVECAGQAALASFAPGLLAAGIDVMAASTGALARPGVLEDWLPSGAPHRGRLFVPSGALAGLDGLGAHRLAGLERVSYTSIKPPGAWRGTPAEAKLDLDRLAGASVFFDGSAREAALAYPKNANLAATVALAGAGLDRTRVRLVADPKAQGNTGILEAESRIGTLRVESAGRASENPKTSASTAFSLAHAVANTTARLVI
jgi:aspartate dehydrogenase